MSAITKIHIRVQIAKQLLVSKIQTKIKFLQSKTKPIPNNVFSIYRLYNETMFINIMMYKQGW